MFSHLAAAIDGVVYIVGGTMAGGQLSSAIRSYSPSTKTWKADAASLPTGEAGRVSSRQPCCLPTTVAHHVQSPCTAILTLHLLTPTSLDCNTARTCSFCVRPMPLEPSAARADAACAASGGVLYIAGGRGADGALLNELIAYEPATGEVKTFSPLAYGSGDVELVALPNGSLLSIGGITNTSTPGLQASEAGPLTSCSILGMASHPFFNPMPCEPSVQSDLPQGSTSWLPLQAPSHYVQQYLPTVDTWVQKAPIALARLRAGELI